MVEKLKAVGNLFPTPIYGDKILTPEDIGNFPQNTMVELTIKSSRNFKMEVIDPEARQQILKTLLQKMRQNNSKLKVINSDMKDI